MRGDDFLDAIDDDVAPECNVEGDFDCFECRERVSEAFHDKNTNILYWWCSKDHQSQIKGFNI